MQGLGSKARCRGRFPPYALWPLSSVHARSCGGWLCFPFRSRLVCVFVCVCVCVCVCVFVCVCVCVCVQGACVGYLPITTQSALPHYRTFILKNHGIGMLLSFSASPSTPSHKQTDRHARAHLCSGSRSSSPCCERHFTGGEYVSLCGEFSQGLCLRGDLLQLLLCAFHQAAHDAGTVERLHRDK